MGRTTLLHTFIKCINVPTKKSVRLNSGYENKCRMARFWCEPHSTRTQVDDESLPFSSHLWYQYNYVVLGKIKTPNDLSLNTTSPFSVVRSYALILFHTHTHLVPLSPTALYFSSFPEENSFAWEIISIVIQHYLTHYFVSPASYLSISVITFRIHHGSAIFSTHMAVVPRE